MAFADLREFMDVLEREGELHRIKAEVDWDLEMGAATRKSIEVRGPALYFEKAKGYPRGYGVLGVPFGPTKPVIQGRVAIALGLPKTTPPLELIDTFRERTYHPIKPVLVDSGPCKEEILEGDDVDVLKFPVPKIHGMDGGRYVGTWDLIVTKDPDTGWVNWGTYRSMVHDRNHLCLLLSPGDQHGGAMFYRSYEAKGKPMPIAIVLGAEPVSSLLGSTPLLYGMNEVDIAGALRQEPVTMVKCETIDLEVPSTAEIVLEGEVIPGRRVDEGPFGEYTGHSAHDEPTPVLKVNCITHRRNPIQTMANMGKPWDDCSVPMSISASAMMARILRDNGVPFKAVYARAPLTCTVISLPSRPGLAQKVLSILSGGWRTGMQYYILVEEDVDVTDLEEVWWAICTRMHPRNGISVIEGVGANTLIPFVTPEERKVHESVTGVLDARFPSHWTPEFRKRHCQTVDFKSAWPDEMQKRVEKRWTGDYGLKK